MLYKGQERIMHFWKVHEAGLGKILSSENFQVYIHAVT